MTSRRLGFLCLFLLSIMASTGYAQTVVVAPGEGAGAVVDILNTKTGTASSFFPYDPLFAGGVRVAIADVNGDGIPDIITGAGPGGGPHVRVFSGKDLSVIWSFYAYDPGFTGGVFVAAGDVDGDGYADIITGAGAGGGPHVRVFSGKDLSVLASFFAYDPGFAGGVSVAAADVNGDGHADIITGAGPGGGPHVRVFSGADLSVIWSFFAYDPGFTGGVFVAASDLNGDGHADIITGAGPGGGPHVRVFNGADLSVVWSFFAYDPSFGGGVRVAAFDTDGDGIPEIVTGAGPGGGPHVRVFRASDLADLGSLYAFPYYFTGGVFVGSSGDTGVLRFTSAAATSFSAGSAGTFTITTTGGSGARTLTLSGPLPSGVMFTADGHGNGTLTGTPGAGTAGAYPLTFTVTDARGTVVTQNFALDVQAPAAITSGNATTFNVGAAGSFTVTTTGFPAAALTRTGALPQGVTFTSHGDGTATLGGTPASGTGGTYPLTITASNGVGSPATQAFTLTVQEGIAFTSAPTATFTFNVVDTFSVTTTGFPAPTVKVTAGVLPTGLTLTTAGVLSGQPTQSGSFPVTLTASNGVLADATQAFTVVVNQAPAITSANAVTFVVNTAGTFNVTMSGFPAPTVSVTSGVLPNGLTLSPAGVLSGPPTQAGSFPVTLTAVNGTLPNATQNLTITVNAPPVFTSVNAATFTVGTFGTFTVTTTGLPAPLVTETGSLPAGVSFVGHADGTATLSGMPSAGSGGTYPLTFTAFNAVGGPVTQNFTLTVAEGPTITSAVAATFVTGTAGTFTVLTTGIPSPTLQLNPGDVLPSGLTFTDNGNGTATLAGPPAIGTSGTYLLTITAANVLGSTIQSFTLTVNNSSTPAITSANNATFHVGALESFTVTTAASPVAGAVAEIGGLPAGLAFVNNGDGTATLSGRPTAGSAGVYPLTVIASNGGPAAQQPFTLTIAPVAGAAPTITSANTATFVIGTAAAFTITTTATPNASIGVLGLPPGLTFNNNGDGTATISGTPLSGVGAPLVSTAGVYPVMITASNGAGADASQSFTLIVANNLTATPLFTSAPSTAFTSGTAGTFSITTAATPAAIAITRTGTLPAGTAFVDNGDGTATLAGTPAAGTAGIYAITLTAFNAGGPVTQAFVLKVLSAPSITSASSTTMTVGTASPGFTVTTSGVPTSAITQSGMPSGVTFVDNGDGTATLGGTPASGTGGPHTLTLTAVSGVGASATQTFTLNINDAGRFTSATSTTFTVGSNGNFLVTTQAFPSAGTITRTGVALPTGVSFNDHGDGTATLGGTPAAGTGGTYAMTFTFTNGVGSPVTQIFTLTVNQPPLFTSASSATFTVGTPGTFTLTANAFPAPTITNTGGTLPTGVTYTSATGVLAGPATQTGAFPLTFTAANGVVPDATQNFTLNVVCPAITVNPSTLADGLFNTAYGPVTFTQTGSTGSSFTWSATGLPAGISIAPTTGIVSGTPTTTVLNSPVTITLTDNFGCVGTRSTTMTARPNAVGDAFNAIGNTQLVVGAAGVTLTTPAATTAGDVTSNDLGPGTKTATFAATSANNGTITQGAATGSFVYTPPASFIGAADTFTYTLTDGNGVTNTGTVTINLSNRIRYVNSSVAGPGDGRSNNPFNTLDKAAVPFAIGTFIYVHTGTGNTTGNLPMAASSTLQGAGGPVVLTVGTTTLSIPAGTAPTLTGTVTLADNTAVKNVNFSGAAPAITASGLATTTPSVIDSVNVSGGTNALSLTNVTATGTGAINVTNSSFANTSGATVLVSSGNVPLSLGASITQTNAARAIDVQNRTGGAVTFSGAISATSNSTGIFLNGNTGGTFAFSGGLTLNGTGSTFTSTNSAGSAASLTTTGTNTIGATTAPTGPALNVANTTIGASGLTFRTIAATGGVNGIVLSNTGNTAGLTVTGTGSNDSGGIIQNTTGDGLSLTSTKSVNLTEMRVANSGLSHIKATGVNGLSLTGVDTDLSTAAGILGNTVTNLVISGGTFNRGGVGAEPTCNVNGVDLTNLLGTSSVTGATFTRSNTVQFRVNNTTATNAAPGAPDTLTVSGTTWDTQTGPCAGDHLSVSADTGGNFKLTTTATAAKNTFQTGGIGVQAAANGAGTMQASITGVQTSGNTAGVAVAATATSDISFNVFDNNTANGTGFSGTGSLALVLTCTTSGTCQGAFSNNTINHTAGTGTNAMQVVIEGDGNGIVTVANNTINGNFQRGFHARSGAGTGLGNLSLHLTGNSITGTDATGLQAVDIEGSLSGDTAIVNTVCLDMSGNTASLAGGGTAYRLLNRPVDVFRLVGFTGDGSVQADIQNWVTTTKGNVGTPVSATIGQAFLAAASCASPTLPTPGG